MGAGPEDRAEIAFEGRVLITLRDRGDGTSIRQRSRPAMLRLNRLWRSGQPFTLRVVRSEGNRARLEVNGELLAEALPGDTRGRPPVAVAQAWGDAVARAFRAGRRVVSIDQEAVP